MLLSSINIFSVWPLTISVILLCSVAFAQESSGPAGPMLILETVDALADLVDKEYFDAEMADRIAHRLKDKLAQGHYVDVSSERDLATELTRDMFVLSKDKHLTVFEVDQPKNEQVPTKKRNLPREERGRIENFGVRRVEVLANNVGYLNLTSFYRPDEANESIAAAMGVLQNADSLIIDMRENGGGSPGTVAILASYLFEQSNLPLFKIISRDSSSRQYSTLSKPPRSQNKSRPIFVLTSARTFSAGEGFAFILQERKRALIVGEITAGAANPGRPFRINQRFEVVIPTGRIATEVTGLNWEGLGVRPDIPSAAAEALNVALQRAAKALQDQRKGEDR